MSTVKSSSLSDGPQCSSSSNYDFVITKEADELMRLNSVQSTLKDAKLVIEDQEKEIHQLRKEVSIYETMAIAVRQGDKANRAYEGSSTMPKFQSAPSYVKNRLDDLIWRNSEQIDKIKYSQMEAADNKSYQADPADSTVKEPVPAKRKYSRKKAVAAKPTSKKSKS